MAYQMVATVVTLNDLEGHSSAAGLFKCNPSNMYAAFYTISTDSILARFLCIRRASCNNLENIHLTVHNIVHISPLYKMGWVLFGGANPEFGRAWAPPQAHPWLRHWSLLRLTSWKFGARCFGDHWWRNIGTYGRLSQPSWLSVAHCCII